MSLVVQKYGGTSLASVTRIKEIAGHIAATKREGHQVVVVVSAMGDQTNHLKGLAYEIAKAPSLRELDVLLTAGERISMSLMSIALNDLDIPCVSFTGSQSGIITDDHHGNAKIKNILGDRLQSALDSSKVAIVAGFQGMGLPSKDITTLGRGGSDLTAVALAHRLNADICEIYTDVAGIFTSDPRFLNKAFKQKEIAHEQLCQLAWSGAAVVHARAAQLAAKFKIELAIRSSFDFSDPGTKVRSKQRSHEVEQCQVVAIVEKKDQVSIQCILSKDVSIDSFYHATHSFFWKRDTVPLIQQSIYEQGQTKSHLVFDRNYLKEFLAFLKENSVNQHSVEEGLCCLNIVGTGFNQDHEKVSQCLKLVKESLHSFYKTNDSVGLLVKNEKGSECLQSLHQFLFENPS